ncbi:hypothetical protein Tco_0939236 [Tanacetum coccineum]|uniref:Uncharacterized protein n=1 Tax=Tanacetum coccineum TaxID=301880 RepID=A0ABQ5DJH7_9ASTR
MQLAEIKCTGRGRVDSMRKYEGTGGINEAAHATAAATALCKEDDEDEQVEWGFGLLAIEITTHTQNCHSKNELKEA